MASRGVFPSPRMVFHETHRTAWRNRMSSRKTLNLSKRLPLLAATLALCLLACSCRHRACPGGGSRPAPSAAGEPAMRSAPDGDCGPDLAVRAGEVGVQADRAEDGNTEPERKRSHLGSVLLGALCEAGVQYLFYLPVRILLNLPLY